MKIQKVLKLTLLSIIYAVLFCIAWIAIYRVMSPLRATKVSRMNTEIQSSFREDSIRIGAYNIAHGRGAETAKSNLEGGSRQERLLRLDKIANLVKEQNLDLVILNEVDFDCSWSHGMNHAHHIAEKAGFPFIFTQRNMDVSFPFYKISIGNAVLSK